MDEGSSDALKADSRDPQWLSWTTASPNYDMLPDQAQVAVDVAMTAMLGSLEASGFTPSISGHLLRVADELGRWLIASGVMRDPPKPPVSGEPDPGHAFMQWWRVGPGMSPESAVIGYSGHDVPLFD